MCDTYEEALASFKKLHDNYKNAQKALDTIKAKYDKARAIIEIEHTGGNDCDPAGFEVLADGYVIAFSKMRETLKIEGENKTAVLDLLTPEQQLEVTTIAMTPLKKYLAPVTIKELATSTLGARTVRIK